MRARGADHRGPGNPARAGAIPVARTLAAFALLLATAACGGGEAPSRRPNLLLITLDTVRADHLGAYGYQSAQTPSIDRLAAEGVRFAHAVAPAPSTLPSHTSIFTGQTPPMHGVRDNAANGLRDGAVTLAETLRAAGYDTGAFVGAYVLDPDRGLAQGFDVYSGVALAPGASPTRLEEAERRGDEVLESALPWLRERGAAPWFAWVHLFDAHAPYAAPEPYRGRFPDSPYDGEIAWLDALVGSFRRELEAAGEWADTTVVLTADHGESLGEHGEPTHGFFVYDATIRVPLVVRPADSLGGTTAGSGAAGTATPEESGGAAAGGLRRGLVVDTPVALIDLFPTMAALAAIGPGGALGAVELPEGLQGRSLLPALRGQPLGTLPIYSESLYPLLQFGWHDLRALTAGDDKLIEAPTVELYDLAADPGEIYNLAAEAGDAVPPAPIGERLAAMREALEPWVAPDLAADGGATGSVTTDPERLAALRSLGYLSMGGAAAGDDLPDPKDEIDTFRRISEAMGRWRGGDTEGALQIIDELIAEEPDFAGARHFRGLVLAGSGRFEEAAAAFEEALALDPDHQVAARALVRTYGSLNQPDRAEALLRDLLARSPGDVELRWELGTLCLRSGRPADAAAVFDAGIAADPGAARMHLGLGLARGGQDDPVGALEALDRAAELEPGLADVQYQRGQVLERLQRPGEALAAYERETARAPRHYPAHFARALILSRQGRNEELIAALEAALEARPRAPEAMLFLAQALLESGDDEQLPRAARLAEEGLPLTQNRQLLALGHATLAEIYAAQGRDEEARREREAAARFAGG